MRSIHRLIFSLQEEWDESHWNSSHISPNCLSKNAMWVTTTNTPLNLMRPSSTLDSAFHSSHLKRYTDPVFLFASFSRPTHNARTIWGSKYLQIFPRRIKTSLVGFGRRRIASHWGWFGYALGTGMAAT